MPIVSPIFHTLSHIRLKTKTCGFLSCAIKVATRSMVKHESSCVVLLQNLSVSARILLAQKLWESIHDSANDMPVTGEQQAVLDQRLAELALDAHPGGDWKDVRRRITGAGNERQGVRPSGSGARSREQLCLPTGVSSRSGR